jgi:Kef-type K+ transport system membrane component KefB
MCCEVVGLVLLQIISSLATDSTELAEAIGRPLGTSIGLMVVSYTATRFVILPVAPRLHALMPRSHPHFNNLAAIFLAAFAAVAAAGYAGSSVLLGAYAAGLVLAALGPRLKIELSPSDKTSASRPTLVDTFEKLVGPCQTFLLVPFFFASIGFSIPIKVGFALNSNTASV